MEPVDPVVILGPTASGKSDVALALAAMGIGSVAGGRVEIVVVDAMQVYRGMDIGTAKPTAADRAAVPHHCLDLVDVEDEFTVSHFQRAARAALADVTRRGGRPLLVAGTGLYLRSVVDDLAIPGTWPEVRARLDERLRDEGVDALHRQLAAIDPVAAARIEPTNDRRTLRALEVCLGSGRPFSSFGPGLDRYPPTPFVQFGLRWPRAVLALRIEQRVQRMLTEGFVDEVRALREAHPRWSRTARHALGYEEIVAHLDGRCTLADATAQIVTRTRQYAARQERWFRRDPRVRWIEVHDDAVDDAAPTIRDHLLALEPQPHA